jgi:hypothetical protein
MMEDVLCGYMANRFFDQLNKALVLRNSWQVRLGVLERIYLPWNEPGHRSGTGILDNILMVLCDRQTHRTNSY